MNTQRDIVQSWFNLPRRDEDRYQPLALAGAIMRTAANIENYNFQQRWRNTVYARLAMGRDIPMSFGLSMGRRVGPLATSLRNAPYVEPHHNVVALAIDTFNNRIGINKPWVTPQSNGGDFTLQTKAQELRGIFAARFEKKHLYRDILPFCFADAATWGTTFAKVCPNLAKTDTDIKRVNLDDMIYNEAQASVMPPRWLIHRDYVFRDDLLSLWEDNPEAAHAIKNAPSPFAGVISGSEGDLDDIVYTLDAYKLPRANGDPGRRVLCLPNFVFVDDDYTKDHFPFAKMIWKPMNLGHLGQGVPEILCKIQQNIDRLDRTIISQQVHGSVFTILNRKGSGLVAQHFANKQGRVLQWDIEKPEFFTPQAVNPELYHERDAEIQQALNFIGLSPQVTSGARDPGITAGTAIRAKEQQMDVRHMQPAKALETFVVDIATLLLESDKEVKPEMMVAGREEKVDWDNYSMEPGDVKLMAFPVSGIPNEPEAKYQEIEEMFANGEINKQEKMLLDDRPDTDAYVELATSMRRHAMQVLDRMIETGKFEAPDAYENWETVIEIAQSRLKQAQVRGVSEDRLRLVEQWIDLAFDLMHNPDALPQPAGIQAPVAAIQAPGQAPAPPPLAAVPSAAAPPHLAPMGAIQ